MTKALKAVPMTAKIRICGRDVMKQHSVNTHACVSQDDNTTSAHLFDVAKEEVLPEVVTLIEDDGWQQPQEEDRGAEAQQRIRAQLCLVTQQDNEASQDHADEHSDCALRDVEWEPPVQQVPDAVVSHCQHQHHHEQEDQHKRLWDMEDKSRA